MLTPPAFIICHELFFIGSGPAGLINCRLGDGFLALFELLYFCLLWGFEPKAGAIWGTIFC